MSAASVEVARRELGIALGVATLVAILLAAGCLAPRGGIAPRPPETFELDEPPLSAK